MIVLKPGQFCTINNTLYRAKKRDVTKFLECTGCALNNFFTCPNICYANYNKQKQIDCDKHSIILVKV